MHLYPTLNNTKSTRHKSTLNPVLLPITGYPIDGFYCTSMTLNAPKTNLRIHPYSEPGQVVTSNRYAVHKFVLELELRTLWKPNGVPRWRHPIREGLSFLSAAAAARRHNTVTLVTNEVRSRSSSPRPSLPGMGSGRLHARFGSFRKWEYS